MGELLNRSGPSVLVRNVLQFAEALLMVALDRHCAGREILEWMAVGRKHLTDFLDFGNTVEGVEIRGQGIG